MANTLELIASASAPSGSVSSFDFNSIPSNYTDLYLKLSVRSAGSGVDDIRLKFNGSTSDFTEKYLLGNGASPSTGTQTTSQVGVAASSSQTANTFNNTDIYIPNYAGSDYKSFSADDVEENNASTAYASIWGGLWSNTAAITSLSVFLFSSNLAQYSTAYLYGIKKS